MVIEINKEVKDFSTTQLKEELQLTSKELTLRIFFENTRLLQYFFSVLSPQYFQISATQTQICHRRRSCSLEWVNA
jgi:hypothetical protein